MAISEKEQICLQYTWLVDGDWKLVSTAANLLTFKTQTLILGWGGNSLVVQFHDIFPSNGPLIRGSYLHYIH